MPQLPLADDDVAAAPLRRGVRGLCCAWGAGPTPQSASQTAPLRWGAISESPAGPVRHSCVGRNPDDLVAASCLRGSDGLLKRGWRAVERLRRERAMAVRLDSCLRRNDGRGRRNDGRGIAPLCRGAVALRGGGVGAAVVLCSGRRADPPVCLRRQPPCDGGRFRRGAPCVGGAGKPPLESPPYAGGRRAARRGVGAAVVLCSGRRADPPVCLRRQPPCDGGRFRRGTPCDGGRFGGDSRPLQRP